MKRLTCLGAMALAVWFLFPVRAQGAERIGEEKFLRVERISQEGGLERRAYKTLIRQEEYQRLKGTERAARIEALKLQLAKKKRKRFSQLLRYQTFYSSNYFHRPKLQEEETTVIHVIPQTKVDLGGDRVVAQVRYSPAVEVPLRFKENLVTRFYQNFDSNLDLPVGKRTYLRGYYGMFRGNDRATSETTNFSLRTEYHVTDEIEYYLSKKTSVAFEHTWDERHFTEEINDGGETREHWFLPRFIYHLSPRTSVFLQTGMGETSGGNGQSDATNLRLTAGLSGRITQKSAAFVNFGVLRKNLSENPPFVDDYTGPFLEMIYVYTPGKKFVKEVRIIGGSSTEQSFAGDSPFFGAQKLNFMTTHQLWRKLLMRLGLGVGMNKYPSKQTGGGEAGENRQREDLFLRSGIAFQYNLRKNITIILANNFSARDSTQKRNKWKENVISAEMVVGFEK
ncbi:MAG: outer membrane beta-barrel protein [Candidatus Omnitrophica bacterium]|nr:outer membrane beta-barrel protein [Candidatus Omnitrophota bacterium]